LHIAEDAMQIDIKTHRFSLTDALRHHARRRLHYALSSIDEPVQRVVVRLSGVNGPRGGRDKRCRLQLVLAGLPDVIVEDTQADLYVAIDRASDRAGRTLLRRLERRKAGLSRAGRRLLTDSPEPAYS
jgi:ribosome-associated translation inhibitor RaiA